MAWWDRINPSTVARTYNPATDEASLDRSVHRLGEILEELERIGQFLAAVGELTKPGPDLEQRLAAELKRVRIPGFCGYKLAQEAWTLLELIAVRVATLRKVHTHAGSSQKLRKLDQIEALAGQAEPGLREAIRLWGVYSSLDGDAQLRAMAERASSAQK